MVADSLSLDARKPMVDGVFSAWVVCLSAGLFFFYEFIQLNLFDVINQPLRADFGIDAVSLSMMSSYFLWTNVLFLVPAGIILDRYSVRHVVLITMLMCIVGTLGFGLTHSFFLASSFHALTGIGNSFCFLSCVVLIARWFPPYRQAFVVGVIVTMAFFGGMMAHTPLAHLVQKLEWRGAVVVDAMLGLLLWFIIYRNVFDHPPSQNHTDNVNSLPTFGSVWHALSSRQNTMPGLFTSLLNLPIMVLGALWGASFVQDAYHVSTIQASTIVSMIYVGSMIGCPMVGWLSDHWGQRKPLMILGAMATLLSFIPILMGMNMSLIGLGALFFSVGFFTSVQVISYPMIAESNQGEHIGLATSIASVIIMGGGALGQLLFGALLHHHASLRHVIHYKHVDYQFALWLFPIAAVIAVFAICLTRETYCQRL